VFYGLISTRVALKGLKSFDVPFWRYFGF